MAVHSNGNGSGWLEDLDADQPHGLDYQEFNDFRIGLRKRLRKEHVEFADATIGGEHIPGGCAVLLIEDNTADVSKAYSDGTMTGGGIAWCSTVGLWCVTSDGTWTGTEDIKKITFPLACLCVGDDITMTGNWKFDNSVDFSGVNIDGTCTIADGALLDTTGAPTANNMIICKGYADGVVNANISDVDGVPTTVYTKYFTGLITTGLSPTILHSIADASSKILSATMAAYNNNIDSMLYATIYAPQSNPDRLDLRWTPTHVIFTYVGSNFYTPNPGRYVVRLDYIL